MGNWQKYLYRYRIQCSLKFGLLHSVLRSTGNLGIAQDIVSAAQRISRHTFQSKGFCQYRLEGLIPTRIFLKQFWKKHRKHTRFFLIKTTYSAFWLLEISQTCDGLLVLFLSGWFLTEKVGKNQKAQSYQTNRQRMLYITQTRLRKNVAGINSCIWYTTLRWPNPIQGDQLVFLHPFCRFTWICHQPAYGSARGFQTVCLILRDISLTQSGV